MFVRKSTNIIMQNFDFFYSFPSIRGVQAGREYYVSMCPLKLIPKLFHFDDETILPEMRAQRLLNKARVPEIARYIVDNRNDYTFSAITASVDGNVKFESVAPTSNDPSHLRLGTLQIPMDSTFIVNDGQHRRAAIEMALEKDPSLGNETIAVVFFIDRGLARCQQMFADLNRHAVRPSASLGVLYDHRDTIGSITKYVALNHKLFSRWLEFERSSLSARSRKLFTLSALHYATQDLLAGEELKNSANAQKKALEFWTEVSNRIPEWNMVANSEMTAGDLRANFVHGHAIVLQALGRLGNSLYKEFPKTWAEKLEGLEKIDWNRKNIQDWEGRAMTAGRMCKTASHIALTCNLIKMKLGLDLNAEDQTFEKVKHD